MVYYFYALPAGPWCFGYFVNGKSYQGRMNVTATGKPCQRWDAQQPHTHNQVDADFPDGNLKDAANFCRNPGNELWPWCYTMTAINWEYCSIQDIVCRKYATENSR